MNIKLVRAAIVTIGAILKTSTALGQIGTMTLPAEMFKTTLLIEQKKVATNDHYLAVPQAVGLLLKEGEHLVPVRTIYIPLTSPQPAPRPNTNRTRNDHTNNYRRRYRFDPHTSQFPDAAAPLQQNRSLGGPSRAHVLAQPFYAIPNFASLCVLRVKEFLFFASIRSMIPGWCLFIRDLLAAPLRLIVKNRTP